MERRRVLLGGRVQGMGLRCFVRDIAEALRLTGWVGNLPNGDVLLEAQGTGAALDALADALLHDPPHEDILVERLRTMPIPARDGETVFRKIEKRGRDTPFQEVSPPRKPPICGAPDGKNDFP